MFLLVVRLFPSSLFSIGFPVTCCNETVRTKFHDPSSILIENMFIVPLKEKGIFLCSRNSFSFSFSMCKDNFEYSCSLQHIALWFRQQNVS